MPEASTKEPSTDTAKIATIASGKTLSFTLAVVSSLVLKASKELIVAIRVSSPFGNSDVI